MCRDEVSFQIRIFSVFKYPLSYLGEKDISQGFGQSHVLFRTSQETLLRGQEWLSSLLPMDFRPPALESTTSLFKNSCSWIPQQTSRVRWLPGVKKPSHSHRTGTKYLEPRVSTELLGTCPRLVLWVPSFQSLLLKPFLAAFAQQFHFLEPILRT